MYGFEYLVRPSITSSNERVIVFAETFEDAEAQLRSVTFNGQTLAAWELKDKKLLATKN